MKKFVGETLQEAIKRASIELDCLEIDLDYEVILPPKKGFLGLGKQDAVILAKQKEGSVQRSIQETPKEVSKIDSYSQIQDNFFQDKQTPQEIAKEILCQIKELFAFLPYEISDIRVRIEKNLYVNVEFDGEDCGLLIGEKGYRYQAIYYLLSIWIKKEYGLGLRLEIADFLKNKEKKIEEYLEENYDKIISRASFQTQAFDPVSASVALKRFREAIPDKYIVLKQISEVESVLTINDFKIR